VGPTDKILHNKLLKARRLIRRYGIQSFEKEGQGMSGVKDMRNRGAALLAAHRDRPAWMECTMCLEIWDDPVMVEDGSTYCRQCWHKWSRHGHNRLSDMVKSPNTNIMVHKKVFMPNLAIKSMVETLGHHF